MLGSLYHIERDPAETLDLSVAESRIGFRLQKTLNERRHKVDRPTTPTPNLSGELSDQLKALGYAESICKTKYLKASSDQLQTGHSFIGSGFLPQNKRGATRGQRR